MDFISTPGASNATSYVSVSSASSYFSSRPNIGTAWSSASSTVQQNCLIAATRAVDKIRFISEKVTSTQSLQFPRACQENTDEIPSAVEQAVYEEALAMLRKKDLREGSRLPSIRSPLAADFLNDWIVKSVDIGR